MKRKLVIEYEEIEDEVIQDKHIPYYDAVNETWKVVTEYGDEEGDAIYVASEFVKSGLYYPFHSEPAGTECYPNHAHSFESVVSFLLDRPKYFSIVGFEEYYSQQERDLLEKIKTKLQIQD